MTHTSEIRTLSAEEISAVAGAGGSYCPTPPAPPAPTVAVTQTNNGTATATSKGGDAKAENTQVNFNVTGVQADVKVEKFSIL